MPKPSSVFGIVIALVVPLACASGRSTTASSTSAPSTPSSTIVTPATTEPVATTSTVADATLEPRECDTAASLPPTDCYWLEVPERRDVPGARTIRLWVAVIHAGGATPTAPPSIYLTGGPGAPASTPFVDGRISFADQAADLVVLDQRGTGRSDPHLACPELDRVPDSTRPFAERLAAVKDGARTCRDRFVADGVDLDGYDTVENAADVVALRKTLGYPTWIVSGVSYGGRLAREVYRQDPAGVRALVLESALTTAPTGPASLLARADDAVHRLAAACSAQPSCLDANGDVETDLTAAATRLDAAPHTVAASVGAQVSVITGADLYDGAFQALYRTDLIPLLPGVAAALGRGDDSALDTMAAQVGRGPAPDPRDDYAKGLDGLVTCADEAAHFTDADRRVLADPGRWSTLVLSWPWETCDVWDVEPIGGGRLPSVSGDLPVLAVYGSLDPVTPPSYVEEIRAQFPEATTLLYPGGGHGVLFMNDCAAGIATSFLASPESPVDSTCVASMPQPFAPAT